MSAPNPRIRQRVIDTRYGGHLPGPPSVRHHGLAQADVCADVTRLALGCNDKGVIVAARHLTYGCPPAIAAAEWLCERLEGQTLAAARSLTTADVTAALDLTSEQGHAAQTVIDALAYALSSA